MMMWTAAMMPWRRRTAKKRWQCNRGNAAATAVMRWDSDGDGDCGDNNTSDGGK